MKKINLFLLVLFSCQFIIGQDTLTSSFFNLDEVTVTSSLKNVGSESSEITQEKILDLNLGQEPSHLFKHMPSIFAMSDNGTEFGYGYFRIRGLDQTRINVTLDGMPWNEAEDFGTYFANSPDLMSSMKTITVERGSSSKTLGISSSAGSIIMESIDLKRDTISHADVVYGSFNSYKVGAVYNMGLKNGFGLHIKATQSGTDGYRDNSYNHSHALTAKLGYYFNNYHSINILTMNGYHENCQGWIGSSDSVLHKNPKANGNTNDESDKWYQSVNKLQYIGWLSNNIMLNTSVYLQYQTGSYRMDLDNYMNKLVDNSWTHGTTNILYEYGLEHYLYGGNINASFYDINDGLVDIMTGVNAYRFQREHYMDNTRYTTGIKNVNSDEFYDNIGYKTDISAYLTMDFHFYPNCTVGYNIQYRYVDFSYKDLIHPDKSFTSKDQGTLWNFLNGGIYFKQDFNRQHNIYIRLAVTNREPTRSTMFNGNETFLFDSVITNKSELCHDLEAGYNFNTKYISGNLNGFFMKFKDELILTGGLGINGLPEHMNIENSYRGGIEASIDIKPIDNFHFITNAAWSRNICKLNDTLQFKHVLTPEWTFDETIEYKYNNFLFGLNYNFRSKLYIDLSNNYTIPNNMTLNAYISGYFYNNQIEATIKFNNITNRTNYYNGTIGANDNILYFQEAKFNMLASIKFFF